MKKLLTLLVICTIAFSVVQTPADASGFFAQKRAEMQQIREYNAVLKELRNIIVKQEEYSNNYKLDSLKSLYAPDFMNADGFNKEVYFKLIKDTWETYPNITYKTRIKNIDFNGNYAEIEVYETAIATTQEEMGEVIAIGELYSTADCIYYLEKIGSNWFISSEKILKETSSLKYGDARYMNIQLSSPTQIRAGEYYTASLMIDAPPDSVSIASINNEEITYPQAKKEDAFRKVPDDNILERVFLSNKNNVNEYTVASVGITKSEVYDKTKVRVYMGGLAFIMTRVNVVPANKFVKIEEENAKDK